jgi:hypothetical protein
MVQGRFVDLWSYPSTIGGPITHNFDCGATRTPLVHFFHTLGPYVDPRASTLPGGRSGGIFHGPWVDPWASTLTVG